MEIPDVITINGIGYWIKSMGCMFVLYDGLGRVYKGRLITRGELEKLINDS